VGDKLKLLECAINVKAHSKEFSKEENAAAQAVINKIGPEALKEFGVEVETE